MKILTRMLCIIILGITILQVACSEQKQPQASGKIIKIGIVGPFSGEDKGWGINGLLGVKTALQLKPYLANGDTIKLVEADDRNTPALTFSAVQRLILQEEVSAILLFSSSTAAYTVADLAAKYKTPLIAVLASHPEVVKNDWITQVTVDDKVMGTVAALYVIDELLIDEVGVFKDSTNPHSKFLADEFERKYRAAGGRVTVITLNEKEDDYSAIAERLQRNGVEFLYLPLDAEQIISIEQAAQEIDWHPQRMVTDNLLSRMIVQFSDKLTYVQGVLATDIYSSNLPMTDYGKRVKEIFESSFDVPGTTFAGLGCEGTSLVMTAMERCEDSASRSCINTMLRSSIPLTGLFGRIRINPDGRAERPVFINIIEGTDMHSVVKIY
ncbi:ABC transporter substrate-binding protein [Desulfosediminicola flagellatus]|uniref:ABC transporter substrate-binding protein n=1 Tax=Desulfosediminicola flagellatus TaxID=2569541 RepID=UPI0010AD0652|nr:ABC transporter substrate-binding protein [Desulfosediminicola flagellatus]